MSDSDIWEEAGTVQQCVAPSLEPAQRKMSEALWERTSNA